MSGAKSRISAQSFRRAIAEERLGLNDQDSPFRQQSLNTAPTQEQINRYLGYITEVFKSLPTSLYSKAIQSQTAQSNYITVQAFGEYEEEAQDFGEDGKTASTVKVHSFIDSRVGNVYLPRDDVDEPDLEILPRCNVLDHDSIKYFISKSGFGHVFKGGAQALLDIDPSLINSVNAWGESVLFIACRSCNPVTIKFLLDRGAAINHVNTGAQCTPIFYVIEAASNDEIASNVVTLLTKSKANVCMGNSFGITPLHLAVKRNLLKTCELLISQGTNKNAKDMYHRTPIDFCNDEDEVAAGKIHKMLI